ncbi:MAG: hypothetical protein KBI47_15310 [Armatimonadetes bacterium]|jgi:peptidoglycan/LPS O-acetylase OafA/YrhL|nr:hypothetical protein [Armatimonadota bacterium]MDI9584994.1 hypothetical protein [Acidobacteriota bacterium]
MTEAITIFIWLFLAGYTFLFLSKPKRGRERTGRRLIGIGALLVAAVLAIPQGSDTVDFGDILSVAGALIAAVMLATGLVFAHPGNMFGQKPVSDEDPSD